jgi:cytosine permease
MNNSNTPVQSQLPSYISSAVPNGADKRAPWYKNTAPTYAGIFLWFVFWQDAVNSATTGGGLVGGLGVALLGLVVAALICHFLFYLVPGVLGMKTGLPLYIVGTSTFGAKGGFIMPGFMMGVLQFGWLGVNVYFSGLLLSAIIPVPPQILMVIWGVLAAFVGLKGIQYVAKVATYLPLIPLVTLLILFFKTAGGLSSFDPNTLSDIHTTVAQTGFMTAAPSPAMDAVGLHAGGNGVLAFLITYIVGFFATAGAAGVDFGVNSRNCKDVSRGGMFGIALAIILTAGLSTCIVAGIYGSKELSAKATAAATASVEKAVNDADAAAAKAGKPLTDEQKEGIAVAASHDALYRTTNLLGVVLGDKLAAIVMFLLALAAFPPACFSSFIAANSFKTTLPQVNPFISVGIGAAVSIILAVTGYAAQVIPVFVIIGASFGPICGAMLVDYLLNGKKWSGPRAGFNPAGWIAWLVGFAAGIAPNFGAPVPAAPVVAFVLGAVVYAICFKIGLKSAVVPVSGALAEATK